MSFYASFQGRVFLGERNAAGLPINLRSPGNVADLKLALKTDVIEKYETQTGQRSLDHRMIKQKGATAMLTIEEFTKENLALAMYSHHTDTAPSTVTDEVIAGPINVGERYLLAHQKVSALQLRDSAGAPATLIAGTHYIAEPDFGAIEFLDVAGFTLPLRASYAFGATTSIGIFTRPLPERFLRFEGINTAQNNAKVLVELYRLAFDPLKELSLISDEYNKFEIEGALLRDSSKPFDADLGQYGRIVQL